MSSVRETDPVKLFVGMLSSDRLLFDDVIPLLENEFGPSECPGALMEFHYTRFYDKEMGSGLMRKFLAFRDLIDPLFLADVKLITNSIETKFAITGGDFINRKINLDPGYIGLSKLVLASVKDRPHRIYIGKGIYSEVTLHYKNKTFQPFPWTYSDYSSGDYIPYLNMLRDKYACELKNINIQRV